MKKTKLNLILDLDQTLLSAEEPNSNVNSVHNLTAHYMHGMYKIFERPGLQFFLDYIFDNFNVSIWTAASKEYAVYVIEKIIINNRPDRKIHWVLFSYHCEISNSITGCDKDISLLWNHFNIKMFKPENTFIIDDNINIWKHQKDIVINIPGFYPLEDNHHKDRYLLLINTYLEQMSRKPIKMKNYIKKINDLFNNGEYI
jgi:TFIIF-interacting CTD phosphatase-like protein